MAAVRTGLTVQGAPLIFFHFSGFCPEDLPRLSRHQNRYRLPDDHPILPLLARYRDRLAAAEAALADLDLRYSFTHYADGSPIPMADRRRVLLADPALKAGLIDPFQGLGDLASTNPLPPWPVPRAEVEAERAQAAAAFIALETQTRALAAERDTLHQALTDTSAAYQAILNSTAWRLTAPLRAVLQWLRRR